MDLFKFDGKTMNRIEFDSIGLKVQDLIDGPYVIKISDASLPVYFVGDHDETHRFLLRERKIFFHMISFINAVTFASIMASIYIQGSVMDYTLHDFNNLIKEVNK